MGVDNQPFFHALDFIYKCFLYHCMVVGGKVVVIKKKIKKKNWPFDLNLPTIFQ